MLSDMVFFECQNMLDREFKRDEVDRVKLDDEKRRYIYIYIYIYFCLCVYVCVCSFVCMCIL